MIAMAAGALHDLDALMPKVKALGMRHVTYGATGGHYEVVGELLLWTLERGLGDAFAPDVRAAWTKSAACSPRPCGGCSGSGGHAGGGVRSPSACGDLGGLGGDCAQRACVAGKTGRDPGLLGGT
jgi:hypothetical protein